jgi:spore coat protein A
LDGGFGMKFEDSSTENVLGSGTKEIWNIYNLTADAHPIHFHLANVLILSRQAINAKQFAGTPQFLGNPTPPDPNEMGWKETVRMNPSECTTLLMDFTLPPDPVVNGERVAVPPSPRTGGCEYVWHCHILEHEEHDMMRPLVIRP